MEVETHSLFSQTQADQGYDHSIILIWQTLKFGFQLESLNLVSFKNLSIRMADHKNIYLYYWVLVALDI